MTPGVSSNDSIPIGFYSQKMWGLLFLALEPWAEGPGMGLGLLATEISFPNFYVPHMDVGPACLCLCPSYQSGWMWFL